MSHEPHSASQFTPSRDHWWHADFLDLMAKRLRALEKHTGFSAADKDSSED